MEYFNIEGETTQSHSVYKVSCVVQIRDTGTRSVRNGTKIAIFIELLYFKYKNVVFIPRDSGGVCV